MGNPARILVVDDDPWIQRTATTILGQEGHLVSLAGDGLGALTSAMKVPPDLVITTVTLPAIEGWTWWERLRALPDFSTTPILFLMPNPSHAESVRNFDGVRDLRLDKPFRVEELDRAVRSLLAGAEPAPPPPARALNGKRPTPSTNPPVSTFVPVFTGRLDQLGLASILTLLEMERKTGMLVLEQPTPQPGPGAASAKARLFVSKGRVIRAEDEGRQRRTGCTAVYDVLTWSRGTFEFLIGDVGDVDEIQASTTFLLIESARRADEQRQRDRTPA